MQEACRCSWIENVPIVDFAKKTVCLSFHDKQIVFFAGITFLKIYIEVFSLFCYQYVVIVIGGNLFCTIFMF